MTLSTQDGDIDILYDYTTSSNIIPGSHHIESINGDINIVCQADQSCKDSIIKSSTGNINILCEKEACYKSGIISLSGDINIQCEGESSCSHTNININGSGTGEINIKFSGLNSGYEATIFCINQNETSSCDIKCTYSDLIGGACTHMNIYYPIRLKTRFLNMPNM